MAQIRQMFGLSRLPRISCVYWMFRWLSYVPVVALTVAGGQVAAVGSARPAPPQDVETALHQMADRADVIFVGQVAAVRRIDGGNIASGVVEVEFRVDQTIRGCSAGAPYVLREWAGAVGGGRSTLPRWPAVC